MCVLMPFGGFWTVSCSPQDQKLMPACQLAAWWPGDLRVKKPVARVNTAAAPPAKEIAVIMPTAIKPHTSRRTAEKRWSQAYDAAAENRYNVVIVVLFFVF